MALTQKPEPTIEELVDNFVRSWCAVSEQSANIAFYRRTMYLAYVGEGFTEREALELIKSI